MICTRTDSIVHWDYIADGKTHNIFLDTRTLSDAEHDEFNLLLSGVTTGRRSDRGEIVDGVKVESNLPDDGTADPERLTTNTTADPAIVKFLDRFQPVPDDAAMQALAKEVAAVTGVSFADNRTLVKRGEGDYGWLLGGRFTGTPAM